MEALNFSKDYILEDDFVRLSPLKNEHIEKLLEISDDNDIWKYFFEKGDNFENLTKYVQRAVKKRNEGKEYSFVVFDKIKNQFAGTTRLYDYKNDLNVIRLGHTWYGKPFRGTGLNKHCKYLVFKFAFEKLKIERIGLGALMDNIISITAMESVGCTKEGILRGFFPARDGEGRTDGILYSILKKEWEVSVKKALEYKLYKN